MESIEVDVRGQDCPIPLMELKRALSGAAPGQLVKVEFTCPEATANIPEWCAENGVEVLSFERLRASWSITVRT